MYYSNEFDSLSVLSLYEGELLGAVHKLYFDIKLKKLIELELIDENGVKFILPAKNIYHVGKNAITVKNNQCVNIKTEESLLTPNPIGSKVYSITGLYLGSVKYLSFDKRFVVDKVALDNDKTLEISALASIGKNTIIFYEDNNKINIKKLAPTKTPKDVKSEPVQVAEIMPIEPKQTKHKNTNSTFLVGRICTKNILNFNNEILIKENSIITKKILKEIIRFGKIKELMIYSK